ncbi:MAG TPA: hypothetical protein VL968_02315 [Rhodocyclaceae bacterium]|nr:hypothetical protein [Rhodocyclaceae bacterium]
MKTRGIQNAINRLKGARKFGSVVLLIKAEEEANHALTQARAWMQRAAANAAASGTENENFAAISEMALELEQTIAQAPPTQLPGVLS